MQLIKPESLEPKPPVVVDVRFAAFDVYCGRRSPRAGDPRCHHQSKWANPFKVETGQPRGAAAAKFAELMRERLADREAGPSWRRAILALEGLRLGCWCRGKSGRGHPGMCHCDVLVELWKELRREQA